jgi:hypothetical protein
MNSALDVLELGRMRGLNTVLEQKLIENAFDDRNSSRFQTLVARVEAKIQNHDAASVCASPASVAIAPATSSEVAPEFQNHIQNTATQPTTAS